MTKQEITEILYEKIGNNFTKKEIKSLVDKIFEIMIEGLEKDKELKIIGFGNWKIKEKRERKGRNPQTGESIIIPSRKVIFFKTSKVLKEKINNNAE